MADRTKAYLGSMMNLQGRDDAPHSPAGGALNRISEEEDDGLPPLHVDVGHSPPQHFRAIPHQPSSLFGMIAGSLRSAGGRSWYHATRNRDARSRSLYAGAGNGASGGEGSRPTWSRQNSSPAYMLESPGSITSPTTNNNHHEPVIMNKPFSGQ